MSTRQLASLWGESWTFPLFVGLALAILPAVNCWIELLESWSGETAKADEIFRRSLSAIFYTAVAAGAWYALAFLVLPPEG